MEPLSSDHLRHQATVVAYERSGHRDHILPTASLAYGNFKYSPMPWCSYKLTWQFLVRNVVWPAQVRTFDFIKGRQWWQVVAYESWVKASDHGRFTRVSSCIDSTRKVLVFWKLVRLRVVVAYEGWSHRWFDRTLYETFHLCSQLCVIEKAFVKLGVRGKWVRRLTCKSALLFDFFASFSMVK